VRIFDHFADDGKMVVLISRRECVEFYRALHSSQSFIPDEMRSPQRLQRLGRLLATTFAAIPTIGAAAIACVAPVTTLFNKLMVILLFR